MRSYDHFYLSVFDDMRGKWGGIVFADLLWIAFFLAINVLVYLFGGWLTYQVLGPEGISDGLAGFFQTIALGIPLAILTGCFEGFAFYALANLPLAMIRHPGHAPFRHIFDAFKDTKRAVITGLFYALILFAAMLVLRFWLILLGILLIPVMMLSHILGIILYALLALSPFGLYAYIYYTYCMVPNILYDNPDKLAFDAFRESKDMMKGFKLSLFKKHLPILLILLALGAGLSLGAYTMIGGARGISETQDMFTRRDKFAEHAQAMQHAEATDNEMPSDHVYAPEPVPVFDPEKMTQRQYLELITQYKQRTAKREAKADLSALQNLIDVTEELKHQSYAPTHHDDIVMARFKRTIVLFGLLCIFLIGMLPFFWAIQAEFYVLLEESGDKKMLEDALREEKLKKAKDFMQRKAKIMAEETLHAYDTGAPKDMPEPPLSASEPTNQDMPEPPLSASEPTNDAQPLTDTPDKELSLASKFDFTNLS